MYGYFKDARRRGAQYSEVSQINRPPQQSHLDLPLPAETQRRGELAPRLLGRRQEVAEREVRRPVAGGHGILP